MPEEKEINEFVFGSVGMQTVQGLHAVTTEKEVTSTNQEFNNKTIKDENTFQEASKNVLAQQNVSDVDLSQFEKEQTNFDAQTK